MVEDDVDDVIHFGILEDLTGPELHSHSDEDYIDHCWSYKVVHVENLF